ncbi:MAG: cytochrome c biogenesis protein CcsA, partial [Microbacteriaceae bacterium]
METLEHYSGMALYSAVIVYSLAFIFYAVDLANRSDDQRDATKSSRSVKIGFSLTVLGFLLHATATVLRGIAAERVPWANMYEFALTATLAGIFIFIIVQFFVDLRFLGTLMTGIAVLFLMVAKVNYFVPVVPLQDALNSYWLVIHILVAVLAVGLYTLAFGLAILQLMQSRRERLKKESGAEVMKMLRGFPTSERLENLSYRMTVIGFVFWTFTLIAGSIWAEASWGRYWGWDTKEGL